MRELGEPIAMVTAYDFPSAQVAEAAGVDIVLVGDSGAMTVLGHDLTVPVGMDEMLMLAAAVRRGLRTAFLVGDMPFGSYENSNEQAIANAQRFIKEAGCDAVKLERGGASVDRARAIVRAGIPVMGHVGLTPQTATCAFMATRPRAGPRAGRPDRRGRLRAAGGRLLQRIVFEAVPAAVTEAIMPRMEVPVIGIGAGGATNGQVLVFHDLLGIHTGHTARFVQARRRHPRGHGRRRLRLRPTSAVAALRGLAHVLDRLRTSSRRSSSTSSRIRSRAPLPGLVAGPG
ncbi:MAG: 3-methyl-2-oxobutanoate hydroxymethyltransferase [Solirubrobacterales bacterium]